MYLFTADILRIIKNTKYVIFITHFLVGNNLVSISIVLVNKTADIIIIIFF